LGAEDSFADMVLSNLPYLFYRLVALFDIV
jgi:hypothetical protein